MFSSVSAEWETPDNFYKKLDDVFHFTIDLAATKENAKCEQYFTEKDDALSKEWNGVCFLNSPYGRIITKWTNKVLEQLDNYKTLVYLMPSRTDTKWFHKGLERASVVCLIKGRLKFINRLFPSYREDGNFKINSAPFPSAIMVFGKVTNIQIKVLEKIGVCFGKYKM